MNLQESLTRYLEGEVKTDKMTKHIYSVDASIFEIEPDLVCLPKNVEDIQKIVNLCKDFQTPLVARGGATGIAGSCLGKGVVIDTTKYLNRILEFNLREKWVLIEPGVVLDDLNNFLAPHGFRIGPGTSASNRATLGGMVATNATGAHFLRDGNMFDHVIELEVILSNGEKKWIGPPTSIPELEEIKQDILAQKIRPPIHRNASGYLLETFFAKPVNYAKLLVGSEGTLGIFSKIKVGLSQKIAQSSLVVLSFSTLEMALEKVGEILAFKPISLELLDHHVLSLGRLSPLLKGHLDWFPQEAEALLLAEFETEPPLFQKDQKVFREIKEQEKVWALRKAGLGLLLSRRSYSRAIAFIEDIAILPKHLVSFVSSLKKMVGKEMGIYGHVGDACLHIRPFLDLRNLKEKEWLFSLMEKISGLVKEHQGVLSGEHGDGLIRSWLNPSFFGEPVYTIFKRIKHYFDPINLMNPGKIVEGRLPDKYVRTSPKPFSSFLNFEKEGGFSLAVDLCNGNGACRKKTTLMCPSFHPYRDERYTTRARAQAIRAFLNDKTELDKELLDVLDYCLECKGCKTECPSQVDMAKMKMEMLYQYQEKNGYFFSNLLFGHLAMLSKMGAHFPAFTNQILQNSWTKKMLGLSPQRALPALARERFSKWHRKRKKRQSAKKVVLFNDTFTEYYCPEVGQAAFELLETLGYSVHLLPAVCCGRPFLSKGLLKQAKKQALKVKELLEKEKDPIIVLEPSCFSALKDDYVGLIGKSLEVFSLDHFLSPLKSLEKEIFLHPHCHEQALQLFDSTLNLFPQEKRLLSKAGCCGLAGSFGYQKKFANMAVDIGRQQLFPSIQSLDKNFEILACGFSCRGQILYGTGRQAKHLAEVYLDIISN